MKTIKNLDDIIDINSDNNNKYLYSISDGGAVWRSLEELRLEQLKEKLEKLIKEIK